MHAIRIRVVGLKLYFYFGHLIVQQSLHNRKTMAVYKYLVVAIIVTSIVLREGESENSHPKKKEKLLMYQHG